MSTTPRSHAGPYSQLSPGWAVLAIVTMSALVRALIGWQTPSPWIVPDEVVYSELSKGIGDLGYPAIRGEWVFGWGEVYPLLLSPAWLLFGDGQHAYRAALVLNSVIMSLAAVPAFLLARLFVRARSAVVVAAATVLVPSLVYTDVIMTENAFYPMFLTSVWSIARTVRDPTWERQLLTLVVLGATAMTRLQGLALVGALVGAALLYAALLSRGAADYLRRFSPTLVLGLVLAMLPSAVSVARGDGAFAWLGARSSLFSAVDAAEVPRWGAYLTAGLLLYTAVIPFLASAVSISRGLSRRAEEPLRLYASIATTTFAAIMVSISLVSAELDVDGTENLNERYVFYVVPLSFVGLAVWHHVGFPRPRLLGAALLGAAAVLVVALPIRDLAYNAHFQSPSLLPWIESDASSQRLSAAAGLFVVLVGALWLLTRPSTQWLLWPVVICWMVFAAALATRSHHAASRGGADSFAGRSATWVDDALPPGATADVVWDQNRARQGEPDPFYAWLMIGEVFNRGLKTVYRLGGPTYYDQFLPTAPARKRDRAIVVDTEGRPLSARFVLTTCRAPVAGRVLATAPRGALLLQAVDPPLRMRRIPLCTRDEP